MFKHLGFLAIQILYNFLKNNNLAGITKILNTVGKGKPGEKFVANLML